MNRDHLFNEILRRHGNKLKRRIANKIFSAINHDDVYQDLCAHILHKIRNSEQQELHRWESESWLLTVTSNFCIDLLRRMKTQQKRGYTMTGYSDDPSELDRKAFAGGYADYTSTDPSKSTFEIDLTQAIKNLPDRDKKLITLRYFKNYSIKEIDEELGLVNSAVYIKRAVDKLRNSIAMESLIEHFDLLFPTDLDEDSF